jgi:hypothetical protein
VESFTFKSPDGEGSFTMALITHEAVASIVMQGDTAPKVVFTGDADVAAKKYEREKKQYKDRMKVSS